MVCARKPLCDPERGVHDIACPGDVRVDPVPVRASGTATFRAKVEDAGAPLPWRLAGPPATGSILDRAGVQVAVIDVDRTLPDAKATAIARAIVEAVHAAAGLSVPRVGGKR